MDESGQHGLQVVAPIEAIGELRQVAVAILLELKGVKRALVVVDMPFGTYQVNATEGVKNAIRIMQETGCDALKLEGGVEIVETVKKIIAHINNPYLS